MKGVKKMDEIKLTPKQKAFADYYIQTGNATEAYKMAGYKDFKSAGVQANKNLNNPSVKEYIKQRMKPVEEKRIADGDEVLRFLTGAMRGEIKDQFDLDASLQDRMKAAELLGKRHRLFTEKVEASVQQQVVFVGESELED